MRIKDNRRLRTKVSGGGPGLPARLQDAIAKHRAASKPEDRAWWRSCIKGYLEEAWLASIPCVVQVQEGQKLNFR